MARILILYFSHKGENYWPVTTRRVLEKGNTEIAAEIIQDAVGGDLFEIVPVKPYTENYSELLKVAKEEFESQARPEVQSVPDVAGYDTVYLCFPNWWGTMPMPVFTVLERIDLSGKKIAPLSTNAGMGRDSSVEDIRTLCPGAFVMREFSVAGHLVTESRDEIADWANACV